MDTQQKVDVIVERYISLRDFKSRVKSEMDEKLGKIDSAMEKLEAEMMTFLNQTGQQSANTPAGTFFKKTSTSSKVADRDIFLQFVIDGGHINFLTNHVSNEAVTQFIEAHQSLPPGIDITRITSVSVNRPKTRTARKPLQGEK